MVKAKAMKKDTVNHWFQQCLKPVLIGLNLVDKQSQIFNLDESSFPLFGNQNNFK